MENDKITEREIQIILPTQNKIYFLFAVLIMLLLFILSLRDLYINAYLVISFLIFMFFYTILSYINKKNRKIKFTPKEFIQKGMMSDHIPWEHVDYIEFLKGIFFFRLFIYHKKSGEIERFIVEYEYIKNKKEFIDSLKKFSRKYHFEFKEKPWFEIEKHIWRAIDGYMPPNHEKYLLIRKDKIPWSTIDTISLFRSALKNRVLALYFTDESPPKSYNFDGLRKKDALLQSMKEHALKNNFTLQING